jgi:putative peptidoglycan lipid II flippase
MAIIKSALVVGSLTLCSRVLGYVRDILIAATLGTSGVADAFFVAFRLPNMFRQLSAEGAMHNAFVPLFSGMLKEGDSHEARHFAGQVITWMALVLTAISALIMWQMPAVMTVLAPGYLADAAKFSQVVLLGRMAFPYIVFVSLAAIFGGMLNSSGKFAVSAATPMLLNIVLIIILVFFAQENPAQSLSIGVVFGGVIQLLAVVIACGLCGMRIPLKLPRVSQDIRLFFKRMVPGMIGGGVTQIAIWINTVIATLVPSAVSYLYYADRLVQFPLALIGTAMGTALLPRLSRYFRDAGDGADHAAANALQNKAIEFVLLLCIPAAVALFILSQPLISLMFERGAFGEEAVIQTAAALSVFAFGLPAFALVKILAPAFFAEGDTRTPVKIALFCLTLGVGISIATIDSLAHVGLALATTISTWCNAVLLAYILIRQKRLILSAAQLWRFVKFMLAALVMGVVVYYLENIQAESIVAMGITIFSGVISYFVMVWLMKATSRSRLKMLIGGGE